MHIALISYDTTLLDTTSPSFERMRSYASRLSKLTVIVLSGTKKKKIAEKNIEVYAVGGSRYTRVWRGRRLLRTLHPSLVSSQDPFESASVAGHVARKLNIPFEVQLHGDFYSSSYWRGQGILWMLRLWFGVRMLKRCMHIRVVSERIKKSLIGLGISAQKISVVPVAIPHHEKKSDEPSSDLEYFKHSFLMVVASRLTHEKHVDLVSRALPYIAGHVPNVQCVVLGEGPERVEVQAVAKSLGESDRLHFHGFVNDLLPYYARADVVVIPSWTEGYGRTAVEAMRNGVPVVMTDVGLAGELVRDNFNGFVVPVDDDGALAEAVIALATDRTLCEKLSKNALATAKRIPTPEELVENVVATWYTLVN